MEKVLYVVDGWDGDTEYFHNEENAKKEFGARLDLVDDCIFLYDEWDENDEDVYIEYKYHDEELDEDYFLTFQRVEFSD